MPHTCSQCGYTTETVETGRCPLCKAPFESSMDPPLVSALPGDKQPAKAKSDPRHWFVRSVHRRSIAVMVLSGFMTVWGLCGGSFTRRTATLTGMPLTLAGLFLFFVCFAIFLATRRR